MRNLAWLVFAASCAGGAFGQESTPMPGKPHEVLARDAGTWDCEVRMFLQGPESAPRVFKGIEENELVSGSMYLKSAFRCPMGELGNFEGHSLMGYDPRTKEYVGTWVDNFTAVPSAVRGTFNADSTVFTMYSTVVDGNGNESQSKQITTWLDDSNKKFEVFLVLQSGGQEQNIKLMEMTAKKRE